ncbi:hypothetical protein N431DRAFT_433513 [Stipitochalara longipes BDJ]|nr:hypothetical protein N431DRAFT_433513 [Stipitochalara longipes BDJ]
MFLELWYIEYQQCAMNCDNPSGEPGKVRRRRYIYIPPGCQNSWRNAGLQCTTIQGTFRIHGTMLVFNLP